MAASFTEGEVGPERFGEWLGAPLGTGYSQSLPEGLCLDPLLP